MPKDVFHLIVKFQIVTRYGIWVGCMASPIGLVLSFAAVNLALAFVIFLLCQHGFVHASFDMV